jgi:hypothetical protein
MKHGSDNVKFTFKLFLLDVETENLSYMRRKVTFWPTSVCYNQSVQKLTKDLILEKTYVNVSKNRVFCGEFSRKEDTNSEYKCLSEVRHAFFVPF